MSSFPNDKLSKNVPSCNDSFGSALDHDVANKTNRFGTHICVYIGHL